MNRVQIASMLDHTPCILTSLECLTPQQLRQVLAYTVHMSARKMYVRHTCLALLRRV